MDKQDVSVTVVVPVFNSGHTLERAINSVTEQTLHDLEVIIVDDGSTDDTRSIAMALAARDSRIRVVKLPQNGGKSRAMNHAFGLAQGKWIAILDADDRYTRTRLATLVAAGEAANADLVADNQLHIDDATGEVVRQAFNLPGLGRVIGLDDFIAHSNPQANFDFGILKPMVRASFVRDVGLAYHPGAKLAEDFYFLMEFFVAGGRGWLAHEPLYEWTLPFSPTARRWTSTGSGAWRYDYRDALKTNAHFTSKLAATGSPAIRALLAQREREYRIMIHYLDAQRLAAEGRRPLAAVAMIARHPSTWPLLARRVLGRTGRAVRSNFISRLMRAKPETA